jgi:hypothetical protein
LGPKLWIQSFRPVHSGGAEKCGESICYWKRAEEFPQFPSVHTKSQVLEIHRHEKNFKVSPDKESHKVEVLGNI